MKEGRGGRVEGREEGQKKRRAGGKKEGRNFHYSDVMPSPQQSHKH